MPGSGAAWPAHWRASRLGVALAASLALHALLLVVKFVAPDPTRLVPVDSSLEVVLLNATQRDAPLAPEVLAQASMQGGGDSEQGRARSPLPAQPQAADGDLLVPDERRPRPAQSAPQRLLAQQRAADGLPEPPAPADARDAADADANADAELRETRQAMARLQAQIARDLHDANRRPRRLTYGINAVGVPFARYVDAWSARIERIGTGRYPPEARGRLYDSLIVLVEIDRHGNVVDVRIPRRSKHEALNRAVREIVLAGQPYDRFSPEMLAQGDVLQIVRTWTFTRGALETDP